MKTIQQSIIKTICYADIFDYPLKQSEIHTYLVWESNQSPPKQKDLIPELFDLTKRNIVSQTNGHFHLPNKSKLVDLRKKRRQFSSAKLDRAQKLIQSIASHPNILGIFITGALAMANADQNDDIDLMIITRANKLWTIRLSTTLKLQFKGYRRTPSTKNSQDLLCTNMYLDETALRVPPNKQNLYTAHEVAQVKPLINKDNIYLQFLNTNSWIHKYLPNILIPKTPEVKTATTPGVAVPLLENLAFKLQYAYMKKKITRETITSHMAYFHPRNTNQQVLKKYQQQVGRIIDQN